MYHDEGHSAALAYLAGQRDGSKGLTGSFGPDGQFASRGRQARDSLDVYFRWDRQDGLDFSNIALGGDVPISSHVVGVVIDVVCFSGDGRYVGRVLNWDQTGLILPTAENLAVPAAQLVERDLGHGTCAHICVWDLHRRNQYEIDGQQALARTPHLARVLDRVEAALP